MAMETSTTISIFTISHTSCLLWHVHIYSSCVISTHTLYLCLVTTIWHIHTHNKWCQIESKYMFEIDEDRKMHIVEFSWAYSDWHCIAIWNRYTNDDARELGGVHGKSTLCWHLNEFECVCVSLFCATVARTESMITGHTTVASAWRAPLSD